VDDGGVGLGGEDGLHFEFDGLDAVALVCADEVFWAGGGGEGGYCEAFFVVCVDDFTDLGFGVLTEFGMRQLHVRY